MHGAQGFLAKHGTKKAMQMDLYHSYKQKYDAKYQQT